MGVSRHPAESNVEMGGAPGESGPSPPLPCGVRPIWIVATGVVLGGMAAAGCGGSQSASPTQRSTSATYVGTDVAWLSSKAEPWNHKLNSDQYAVLAATNASSEDATGTFLARLGAACHQMSDEVGKAQDIVHAPSATLDKAWGRMLAQTKVYTSDCLTVARSQPSAVLTSNVTKWTNSVTAMDPANATFNTAVTAVRKAAGELPG